MMPHLVPLTVLVALPVVVGVLICAGASQKDPTLDACAREHNVYACEYVAQPKVSNLLPPPEKE